MKTAYDTSYSLANADLTWCTIKSKLCNICGSPTHEAKTCQRNKSKANSKYAHIYNRYKPANYKNLLPKQKQQSNRSSPGTMQSDAKVKTSLSYANAAALSGQTNEPGLNESIYNPKD